MSGRDVLVADDGEAARMLASMVLQRAGFAVHIAENGREALAMLSAKDGPRLALLDWMMPGLDGPEVIRRVRRTDSPTPPYLILLTSRDASADIVAGLEAGANDYLSKPVHREELVARLAVGVRVLELQEALAERVRSLEVALGNVKMLQGLLPICSYCKSIRNDQNYWQKVESYFHSHAGMQFSHGHCPSCYERYIKPELDALEGAGGPRS
jgi:sigma-B regulation protein RsbU (phosphoserine phosphatase)